MIDNRASGPAAIGRQRTFKNVNFGDLNVRYTSEADVQLLPVAHPKTQDTRTISVRASMVLPD